MLSLRVFGRLPWAAALALTLLGVGAPAAVAAQQVEPVPLRPALPAQGQEAEPADEDEPEIGSSAYQAVERVRELQRLRVDLLLADLQRAHPLEEPERETARETLHAACDAFYEANPPKHVPGDQWGQMPATVQLEPFADLLASEVWRTALEGALDAEARDVLAARARARDERLRTALEAYLCERLRFAWSLADPELEALEPTIDALVADAIDDGVVAPYDPYAYYNMQRPEELTPFLERHDVVEALSPARAELVQESLKSGRTHFHDYALEAEFHLAALEGAEEQAARRLLRGYAEAMLRRDGSQIPTCTSAFAPSAQIERDEFWSGLLVETVLGAHEDAPPEPPSRSDEALRASWTTFLLEALDRRALFSTEQREGLEPLLREYVERRFDRYRGRYFGSLQVPSDMDVPQEETFVPQPIHQGQLDTKLKSVLDTLHSFCDETQREVLGA